MQAPPQPSIPKVDSLGLLQTRFRRTINRTSFWLLYNTKSRLLMRPVKNVLKLLKASILSHWYASSQRLKSRLLTDWTKAQERAAKYNYHGRPYQSSNSNGYCYWSRPRSLTFSYVTVS